MLDVSAGSSLRGFLADGDTGAGLPRLRVELWSAHGAPAPLAAARSDEAGVFTLRLDRPPGDPAGEAELEFRVKDAGRLIHSEVRRVRLDEPEAIELQVPRDAGVPEAAEPALGPLPARCEVRGRARGPLLDHLRAEAVVTTLAAGALREEVVAEGAVNAAGWYRLQWQPADAGASRSASLTVRLRDATGAPIAESAPLLSPPSSTRIDLRIPADTAGPSELALLEQRAASALEGGLAALDGLAPEVIGEVAGWLDVEPERLRLLQRARALGAETDLPPAVFYALGRSGLSPELADLADASLGALRLAADEAVDSGIVDGAALDDPGPLLEAVAARALDAALASRGTSEPGLGDVLAAADLPEETIHDVLHAWQHREADDEFWESFGEGDGEGEAEDPRAPEVRVAVELAGIVGVDPPLLGRLHALRRDGRWRDPEDLADLGFEDWCALVEETSAGEGEEAPDAEAVEARAGEILSAMEEAFPSPFIRKAVIEGEEVGPAARQVLARARHDLRAASIRAEAEADPALLEGLDEAEAEAAVAEIEAVERISRVAARPEEVALLVGTGMRSALEVASTPRSHFIAAYAGALGGRPQAARLHAEAQQAAAAAKLATVRLVQAHQQTPFVLGSAVKDVPDAVALFGGASLCACADCGSVYSPAAYLVDLLRYLNVQDPKRLDELRQRLSKRGLDVRAIERLGRYRPLDVLLARRPDLAHLPLTCENTLTPLPYIDLVNEVLEARVTGGSAAFDTGKTPADVLRAVPQHSSREAYRRLQEAVHPLALPFHEPLAVARAYLGHLGVSRLELLKTFGTGAARAELLAAESLGMSPEELQHVIRPPTDPWRHLGLEPGAPGDGARWLEPVSRAPAFLEATGLGFAALVELAATRFVNPDGGLALESPAPDCDAEKIVLAGLDAARVARMIRLVRLQRRLGWSFADLDRALQAFGAADLDLGVVEKLADARELARRLDRPIAELLVLWAPLDTWGPDSQFERLLASRAVAWRTEDLRTFQLREDRAELAVTGDRLDPVAPALLAAFRITSQELARIQALLARRGAPPKLDLAGLSAVQRVVVLSRALRLRVDQLDALLRLAPPEADPFRPGDPAGTRRFVELAAEVAASEFSPERLVYLLRHEAEPGRDPSPLPAQAQAVLASIRRGLLDAIAETRAGAEAPAETLRRKLGTLLETPLVAQAIDVLDSRSRVTPPERRAFFDRHLARIFPDAAAAAARLFGPAAPAPASPPAPGSATAPALSTPSARAPAPAAEPALEAAPAAPPAAASPAPPGTAPSTTPAAEPAAAPTAAAGDPAEERWFAQATFVLGHLLPYLRVRQTRGAIVQALAESLGLGTPATARLLEVVLRSRREAGAPLLADFLALAGTGLTGTYFANPDLGGTPAVARVDPELSFSWSGAPPADGVPARGFSVRWTGRFLPRATASHLFYARTDGAVRLGVVVAGAERVVLDRPAAGDRVVELVSEPIELPAGALVELRLEYRNTGGPATLAIEVGTAPGARAPIATADLFPQGSLDSFAPIETSYRRLHKASLLLAGLGLLGADDAQLAWLTSDPPYLDLDALPMEPGAGDAVALFRRWRWVAALVALRKRLPRSDAEPFDALRAPSLAEGLDRLAAATGWDRSTLEALAGPQGLALDPAVGLRPPLDGAEPAVLRLARAMDVHRRVGVAPATLTAWASGTPDADAAAAIVQAVKARYDEPRWLEVARALNDPLRAERRDALVAYLLPRMRPLGVRKRSQLFEFFLVDVEMSPCMLTSRVKQAISAVQTFFQRCLMNLEPEVNPRLIDDADWKWLKSYRVWEANRKVFLYPENWIEPELRDDKSPLFEELERSILQQEIKKENVEAAFADYLAGLDGISRLDVRGVWFERRARAPTAPPPRRGAPGGGGRVPAAPRSEWDQGTYHVFARTFNAPHVWYQRRLEDGRRWTPWQKVDADIEGEHLVPVMFQRRMHLFWTVFREAPKPAPPPKKDQKGAPPQVGKDWEIHLAYSVFDRGRWSPKRMSAAGARDVQRFRSAAAGGAAQLDGSNLLDPADYTLRAMASEGSPSLRIHLYRRRVDLLRTGADGERHVKTRPAEVELVARFALEGCNGELVLDEVRPGAEVRAIGFVEPGRRGMLALGRPKAARAPVLPVARPFDLQRGGALAAPLGYRVSGTGFVPVHAGRGAILAVPGPRGGGHQVALGSAPGAGRGARIVPVVDPARGGGGLQPLFYQDRDRSYFARPVFTGWRPPRLLAMPLVGARAPRLTPRFGRAALARPAAKAAQKRRPAGKSRESLDEVLEELGAIEEPDAIAVRDGTEALDGAEADPAARLLAPPLADAELETVAPDALDAWEDLLDEAWHPDDAGEARPVPRGRGRPPAPRPAAPRPAPGRPARRGARPAPRPALARRQVVRLGRVAGFHEQRLRFTPFEHPTTCALVLALKARGIEGLLALGTTRPARGLDHDRVLIPGDRGEARVEWKLRRPTWFERRYRPGPLVDQAHPPHLDVDFDPDGPYGLYNWELFFHAPLQVAIRLAKDGRHEEAQRWFHFVFDPTTDVSGPAPQRYWRFAPFHENTEYAGARELVALLSYSGDSPALIRRQRLVLEQVTSWWEKPFDPHAIARLRTAAYQKAVVMKYVDNLIEWADKQFRRDTLETIQEATQLYILAGNILGPRPERIAPLVSRPPATFAQVRDRLDAFANWEVRLENSQVRRPFRIAARPDVSGAASILGMATQYFCLPPNPQLDKQWDTVADRLFKIRNCMNIQGVVRQLALFEPPIDPALLVRAAAAGVDLGSVAASLNAPPPHHRFRVLLRRALALTEELRTFGAATLRALERKDAEALAALRASSEAALLDAMREVKKKEVRQVEEVVAQLGVEREHVELQIRHVTTQLQTLMNPQEEARQKSLTAGQAISAVAEGADLLSKVLYAIPDFQTGTAGGFSSPFVTLQLGGQMFGDIAAAFAESAQKVMERNDTEADLAAVQAEYQRRREEWQNELELLGKEKGRVEKQLAEVQLRLEIANAELRRHDVAVENARKTERWLRDKYTSEQLYGWMLGQLSTVHFQAYKLAFDAAQTAERAYRFERGEPSASFVEFSYWDSLKKGLLAGERLLVDLRRMEAAHLEGDRRALEITRHVSLHDDHPAALQQLLATGSCEVAVTEALLDGDFPGHYFRRLRSASLTVAGAVGAHANVNCTLTLLANRIRVDPNASGSYPASEEGDDGRFLVNLAPVQAVATSRPTSDAGVFELRFDDDRLLPFEGAGAISTWRVELRQDANAVDLSNVSDVVLTLAYTARGGGAPLAAAARASREKLLGRGGLEPAPQKLVSLRRDLPGAWQRLAEATPGADVELSIPLDGAALPGRFRGLDVRVERVVAFAHPRAAAAGGPRVRVEPPRGAGAPLAAWDRPWSGARALRAGAEVSGPAGTWKVSIGAAGAKVTELFDDVALAFELRARRS